MTRKLLSLLVAVAVVLSSFSVAFAATVPSDVTSGYVKAVSKLGSLNIMNGYPDGTFKPDQTITRAEFAKIAVVALGLNDSATISAGATNFSDVAADHWASGFINVASSQGIINGYPDGTYKPEQTINYAESITILAKMLGYGPILAGKAWPAAYVAKANEVGISSGVVLAPTVGASRGNVAKLMSNTLDAKIVEIDSYAADGKPVYKVSTTKTLLSEKLSVTAVEDASDNKEFFVTTTPEVQSGATVAASTLDTEDTDPDLTKGFAASLNPNDYLGLNVKAWTNGDGDVCIAEVQNASADIYEGAIQKDGTKIKLIGKSTSYEEGAGFVGYINSSSATFATIVNTVADPDKAMARVVLKDGKVKFINAYVGKDLTTAGNTATSVTFTVKEIKDGYIRAIGGAVGDIKISDIKDAIATKSKRYDFIKGGTAVTIDDVKAGDVITKTTNVNYQRWVITANEVKGTLASVSGSGATMTLSIGGTGYKVASAYKWSFNNGDDNWNKSVAGDDVTSVVGKEVTIKLNAAGQIAYLCSTAASVTYNYAIYKEAVGNVGANYDTIVKMYKADGTLVSYPLEYSSDNTATDTFLYGAGTSRAIAKGDLVQYKLTSDGKIAQYSLKGYADYAADLTKSTVAATAGNNKIGTVIVSGETVIWNVYNLVSSDNSAPTIATFSTIDGKAGLSYTILSKDSVAKFIKVNGSVGGTTTDTLQESTDGVVVATGKDADGSTISINVNGTVKNYKVTASSVITGLDTGAYITYNVNSAGKVSAATQVNDFSVTGAVYRVMSVDTVNKLVKVQRLKTDGTKLEDGTDLFFMYDASNLNVYDATDKGNGNITGGKAIGDIAQYDYVWLGGGSGSTYDFKRILKVKVDDLS